VGANTGECIILGMFGPLGGPELVLILVLALIVFGPRRLPEIGKSMGRLLSEFRKASHDFQRTIEDEVEAEKQKPSETILTAPPPMTAEATPRSPAETTVVRDVTPPEPVVAADGPAPPPRTETK